MHFAFVIPGLPAFGNHGGALSCMAIVKHMADKGHQVTVVSLYNISSVTNPYLEHRPQNEAVLVELGVRIEAVEYDGTTLVTTDLVRPQSFWSRARRWLWQTVQPDLDTYYPWSRLQPHMATILDRLQPDAIFCYHFEALAATHTQHVAPRMACVVDLSHLPEYFRWRMHKPVLNKAYLNASLHMWRMSSTLPRLMRELMNACERKADFGPHYAAWFRKHGVPDCQYLRTPVPDPVGTQWREKRAACKPRTKPKILMIGVLRGTATTAGLRLFATETLPALEHTLGTDGFEVHLVGQGPAHPDVAPLLERPSVIVRGPVEPAHAEFLSADVLLVPTPMTLGVRVRILAGLSYGCCVITHQANTAGIPELTHGENALIGTTGQELAEQIIRALQDDALRHKLQANARRTYEQYFSEETAAGAIVAQMEELGRGEDE